MRVRLDVPSVRLHSSWREHLGSFCSLSREIRTTRPQLHAFSVPLEVTRSGILAVHRCVYLATTIFRHILKGNKSRGTKSVFVNNYIAKNSTPAESHISALA